MSYRRWALTLWSIIFVVISARVLISPAKGNLYSLFSNAGRHWIAGKSAYLSTDVGFDGYRYMPPVTAFFALCSYMPDRMGDVVWRGLNAAVLFGGLVALSRLRRPQLSTAAMCLLVIPLAIGGLNNGQANALDAGMLLLAAAAFADERPTIAAALLVCPVMFKAYPLALGLLFCLVEPRRFAPRFVVCLLIGAAVPYLTQKAEFVTAEYTTFYKVLCLDDRSDFGVAGYRDLQSLTGVVGMPMSLRTYRILEMALGAACGAIVVAGRVRGWNLRTSSIVCLSLSLCWMTLAGPATESCTFVLISPILAMSMLTVADRAAWQRGLVRTSFALFTVAAVVVWFPRRYVDLVQGSGVQPLAALLLTIHVVAECMRPLRRFGVTPFADLGSPGNSGDHFLSVLGKSANSSRTAA